MEVAAWIGAYDLAEPGVCWRPRRGGGMKQAVEQGDQADEGRLEGWRGMVVGRSAAALAS